VLLRVSLSFLLGAEAESVWLTIWKLLVLVEFRLTAVSSLGTGLFGGCNSDTGRLLEVLESVLVLEICLREAASLVFSSEACRTFTLTRPRLEIGSRVITRGFGTDMWPMSIESWNFMCR
jgi:hypothetical protein